MRTYHHLKTRDRKDTTAMVCFKIVKELVVLMLNVKKGNHKMKSIVNFLLTVILRKTKIAAYHAHTLLQYTYLYKSENVYKFWHSQILFLHKSLKSF